MVNLDQEKVSKLEFKTFPRQPTPCFQQHLPSRKNLTTTFSDKGGIVVTTLNGNKVHLKKIIDLRPKMYKFDAVFSEKSTQEEVFTSVCPFVKNYLSGLDSTLLVYGQSGSGKSFRQKCFFLKKFSKV